MKQLLQNIKNGNTIIEDIPVPTPREGQALVKVSASLVSAGTERMVVEFAEKSYLGKARSRPDLVKQTLDKAKREGIMPTVNAVFNRLDQPMALGYSTAGTIVALGKNMQGFKVGQRVACAGGGYATHAEYNVVPRNLLTPLPKNVDFESAAFTTLGAISLHGFRLAEPQLGENVAVIGLGLLGLLTIQLAAAAGCNVLGIDLDPKRIKLASSLGLQAVTRPKQNQPLRHSLPTAASTVSSSAQTLPRMTPLNWLASSPVTAPKWSPLARWDSTSRARFTTKKKSPSSTPAPTAQAATTRITKRTATTIPLDTSAGRRDVIFKRLWI
ncbi:MAG: zinc-binding alcohol dehydrogenase [Anaerolineales bacterium]|nr:zinc-binding alcohol dehydrogenase [Anaerolineales bacterium]